MEPRPPVLGVQSLSHWMTRQIQRKEYFCYELMGVGGIKAFCVLIYLGCNGSSLQYAGSVIMALGPSLGMWDLTFPDQGSNPGPLHWESYPLDHRASPKIKVVVVVVLI